MGVDVHAAMAVRHPGAVQAVAAPGPAAAPPIEPLLEEHEIQGNVIPGFLKPEMVVVLLQVDQVDAARAWVAGLAEQITTLADVMPSRIRVREERYRRQVSAAETSVVGDAHLSDVWFNIAFSHQGLSKLLGGDEHAQDVSQFTDEAFVADLAARSALLGDPTDPAAEGNPERWLFGGPGKQADVLLVFGADQPDALSERLDTVCGDATDNGLKVLHKDQGSKLPDAKEHFGFKDGVSQPGVRGRISGDRYVTARTIDHDAVPEAWLYGLPGQYLVWPGAFVFGYPTPGADPMLPGPPQIPGPSWSRNGSYAVYRRLRQDVAGFRRFLDVQAASLNAQPGFEGMTPERLGALLVGRWHSGAPVSRTPDEDIPEMGGDVLANNHFGFAADTPPLPLIGGQLTNKFPEAAADPIGLTCPLAAHIRKVNTRDVGNDQGGRRASFERRILRRALPYGDPIDNGESDDDADRGLMFLCYQASIVDQFEFLNQTWMSDPAAPRAPSGHDMVVGQNGQPGEDRERSAVFVTKDAQVATVTSPADFVVPTGGGYFFTPSVSALRDVIGKTNPPH